MKKSLSPSAAVHLRALKDTQKELERERAKRRRAESAAARMMKARNVESQEVRDAKDRLQDVKETLEDKWQEANIASEMAGEQTSYVFHN